MKAMDPWGKLKEEVVGAIEEGLRSLEWEPPRRVEETLSQPPDPELGDLSSTLCLELSKKLGKPPQEVAQQMAERMRCGGLLERVEVVRGYLNFFINLPSFASLTLGEIEKRGKDYGKGEEGRGRKVVIEHTSVNPTKPLHIGHGRNAVLGDTMARVLRERGYEVEVHNYIDDLGRQMAETLVALSEIEKKPEGKFDHVLGKLYAEFHQLLEGHPELEEKVGEVLRELERGGGISKRAREVAEKCIKANLFTTDRLGVGYNLLVWESDLVRSGILHEVLERLKGTPYLVKGEGEKAGTWVLRLPGEEEKVLIRSDGTAVYTARDIAYQVWKFGCTERTLRFKFHSKRSDGTRTYTTSERGRVVRRFGHADVVINVIGAEQKFPQRVVFSALKALGLQKQSENSYHLAYEHVRLPEERFSGRKGTWIGFTVDEVVEEAVSRAGELMKDRSVRGALRKKIPEGVGVGAVRFSLLSTSPEKEIVFKWEEALNFERNSGPAVQYSYARACSILRKARGHRIEPVSLFELREERELLKLLAQYPEAVRLVGEKRQPSLLARYAADLSMCFNKFYEVAPVLEAETEELRSSRLRLVRGTKVVLGNAMRLLGVPVLRRM
ncbi:MAG: arginine--tRNA ligase [Candidatus Hadarchaeales archaeon]